MADSHNPVAEPATPAFRLDVHLHELLMNSAAKPTSLPSPLTDPQRLPEPVFPSRPNPKFEMRQLKEMKKSCEPHCFSTLNHIVDFCYNDARVIKWLMQQALRGFQGVTNWND